eukprot:431043_1
MPSTFPSMPITIHSVTIPHCVGMHNTITDIIDNTEFNKYRAIPCYDKSNVIQYIRRLQSTQHPLRHKIHEHQINYIVRGFDTKSKECSDSYYVVEENKTSNEFHCRCKIFRNYGHCFHSMVVEIGTNVIDYNIRPLFNDITPDTAIHRISSGLRGKRDEAYYVLWHQMQCLWATTNVSTSSQSNGTLWYYSQRLC